MNAHIKPADLSQVKRNSIHQRKNLVHVSEFAKIPSRTSGFLEFLESLPTVKHRTNAAASMKYIVHKIAESRQRKEPVTWALGPHIIKYGLSPLIVQLMDEKLVAGILLNGAGAIHDTEIALIGSTSEEMAGHISTGEFGMSKETGEFINSAAFQAMASGQGFGWTLGTKMIESELPYLNYSLIAQAAKRKIPVTIHAAIGTDIIHMHPDMNGAATGEASFTDFRITVSMFRQFKTGGIHLNIGSTVILPEVFVKAMTCANNLNATPASGYITVNIDHLSEYRPLMNVVNRGSLDGGEGYEIIGRMEILVPLLVRLILEQLSFSQKSHE